MAGKSVIREAREIHLAIDLILATHFFDAMAERMRECANDLARIAERMRANGDIELTGDAANSVANLIPNLRLDLLVQRPIRALRG